MRKFIKATLFVVLAFLCLFGSYAFYKYNKCPEVSVSPDNKGTILGVTQLDHDIYVNEDLFCIYNGAKTGFDVTVGPTGWPVGSDLKWEIALYRGSDAYYARLILHEYMLWWSWDDPYILVKIPKQNVTGDPVGDEKFRWNMLWDITYVTFRSYNYSPYINDAEIKKINGHKVYFGGYVFSYEKYFVICDKSNPW